ncbi:MAG: dihydroorotate dehydrogenase electron transfer subunit [Nitrospiraceae bacterium]|nr:MAG: dihydroorotate dehydrogenase electron transfer subunit [Nitrospiraceae bacterium]
MDRLFTVSVTENRQLIENHFLLTLHPRKKIRRPEPGTFFMLSVDSGLDPLLKRPLSVHRWLGSDFQLLYRVAGKGTAILSRRKPGDILEVIGPLGNGFPLKQSPKGAVLVAGGIGIAPVFALAEKLSSQRPLLFYGARTKQEVLCLDGLKRLGVQAVISTDDGSLGTKGSVINVLTQVASENPDMLRGQTFYACGPEPMLTALSGFAVQRGMKGYAALEERMACGIGTCLGCVVNTTGGYKRVCKEGPVFALDEVIWERGKSQELGGRQ